MRSLLLALSAAFLILATTACSGGQSAEPAPSVPLEQEAPADPEASATSPGAAEDVAMGFLEAYGSFDADRAITYLAPDADVSGLISSVGGGSLDGGLEGFRLLLSMLEAEGYKQILHGCDDMGSGEGRTFLTCDFDFHVIRSDELGLGPYSGSHFFLTVRDGKIVEASKTWAIGEFSPQVWEPFAAWVTATYPEDVEVMYTGAQTGLRLTEESISLWEQRTREYVEHVRSDGDGAAAAEQTAVAAETVAPPDYSDDSAWICRPGRDDVCEGSLDITMVSANGSTEVVEVPHASDAPVDCLYVYPTVSQDKLANSDLVPGETEEIAATLIQAARFGSVCDVYVPVYRQITLAALFGEVAAASDPEIAYGDVLDAFRHYLANDGTGRGFVLIGHSQGADLVSRLIREDIAGVPALRERLVSAIILGPPSSDVLPDIPPCTHLGQVGCLIAYATYDAASPPPGIFGAGPALCANPAALGGGSASLHPAFVLGPQAIVGGTGGIPFADSATAPEITTAWVGYPDFVTGECVDDGTFGYLSVTIAADPADARTDDLAGDTLGPEWGQHHLDGNIALDDLVAVVGAQARAYTG